MKKYIVKSIIFVMIFIILLTLVSKVLVRKGNGFGTDVLSFYNEPKNSLDLIFFGSSHSYATFSPQVLYNETGLKSYNFATQQQPLWITYYYMKESLKYQKPKYFVLEILMTKETSDYMSEGVNRDAIDKMRFSLNKIEAINASVEDYSDRISYYLNIIKYHSRWNEINKKDFRDLLKSNINTNKGFTYLSKDGGYAIRRDITQVKDIKKITSKNEMYLNKMIQLAKDYNINLIFVKAPCTITQEEQQYYNYVEQIANSNSILYLNYNLKYDELELDFENDFYDTGHLKGKAAERVTKNFANYLKREFNIGDNDND